jgi:hypothetical protein
VRLAQTELRLRQKESSGPFWSARPVGALVCCDLSQHSLVNLVTTKGGVKPPVTKALTGQRTPKGLLPDVMNCSSLRPAQYLVVQFRQQSSGLAILEV